MPAPASVASSPVKPTAAKMPRKARMVTGLVIVRKKVENHAPKRF
jgi:hypothetical protein